MKLVSSNDTVEFFESKYQDCSIRYGDMKKQLAEDMVDFIAPINEEIRRIASDDSLISKVMDQGAEKAHASAYTTISEVRNVIGFRSR
jgi:tryptophanyl-tRNA synthetase